MEDELQKQNTDCVYFLASPLTCKKGVECEYRHNEIARLNPRDCWYWLAGNCLNPTCAFRHPPLEMHTKASSEASVSSEFSNKINVPCYFYFSSFCNKGEKCSFMHSADPKTPAGKSGNTTSEAREGVPLDYRTCIRNDCVPSPKDVNNNSSKMVPKAVLDLKFQPKEDIQLANTKSVILQSPLIPVSQSEEAVSLKRDLLLFADNFVQNSSHICTDQSSEEQMDDHVEPDDRKESSPGFDVLVDDKLENLGYEDDQEYLLAINRERREMSNRFLRYNIEDIVEYDPAYSDAEVMRDDEILDSFEHVDDVRIIDIGNGSGHSGARTWGSLLSHKRKLLPMELAINDQRAVDLRDHLRRRRLIDELPVSPSSKRHDCSHLLCSNQGRTRRPGISQRLQERLALEVRKNASCGDDATLFDGPKRHHIVRPSSSYRSRCQLKEKRLAKEQFFPSEVPRKVLEKERRCTRTATEFTGPKTLAQIREKKKKTGANGDFTGKTGNSSGTVIADFEGPKPLSEILKDKKRSGFGQECCGSRDY
ncbi:zinc finger CCCH domain-containing protein 34-like [Euphorbia lathyris]|uniref:zinc finger CCCH domain-containing protein 34-like n=1 Tax=Euphorbia lathyris TaxID=212925 RepID=UPI003313E94B